MSHQNPAFNEKRLYSTPLKPLSLDDVRDWIKQKMDIHTWGADKATEQARMVKAINRAHEIVTPANSEALKPPAPNTLRAFLNGNSIRRPLSLLSVIQALEPTSPELASLLSPIISASKLRNGGFDLEQVEARSRETPSYTRLVSEVGATVRYVELLTGAPVSYTTLTESLVGLSGVHNVEGVSDKRQGILHTAQILNELLTRCIQQKLDKPLGMAKNEEERAHISVEALRATTTEIAMFLCRYWRAGEDFFSVRRSVLYSPVPTSLRSEAKEIYRRIVQEIGSVLTAVAKHALKKELPDENPHIIADAVEDTISIIAGFYRQVVVGSLGAGAVVQVSSEERLRSGSEKDTGLHKLAAEVDDLFRDIDTFFESGDPPYRVVKNRFRRAFHNMQALWVEIWFQNYLKRIVRVAVGSLAGGLADHEAMHPFRRAFLLFQVSNLELNYPPPHFDSQTQQDEINEFKRWVRGRDEPSQEPENVIKLSES